MSVFLLTHKNQLKYNILLHYISVFRNVEDFDQPHSLRNICSVLHTISTNISVLAQSNLHELQLLEVNLKASSEIHALTIIKKKTKIKF